MRIGKAPHLSRLSPEMDWNGIGPGDHLVQLYDSEAFIAGTVASFIGSGFCSGGSGMIIATPVHREAIDERLASGGIDLAAARADGRYLSLDAAETLSKFMLDDRPDA